jgi:hypothetical protein
MTWLYNRNRGVRFKTAFMAAPGLVRFHPICAEYALPSVGRCANVAARRLERGLPQLVADGQSHHQRDWHSAVGAMLAEIPARTRRIQRHTCSNDGAPGSF